MNTTVNDAVQCYKYLLHEPIVHIKTRIAAAYPHCQDVLFLTICRWGDRLQHARFDNNENLLSPPTVRSFAAFIHWCAANLKKPGSSFIGIHRKEASSGLYFALIFAEYYYGKRYQPLTDIDKSEIAEELAKASEQRHFVDQSAGVDRIGGALQSHLFNRTYLNHALDLGVPNFDVTVVMLCLTALKSAGAATRDVVWNDDNYPLAKFRWEHVRIVLNGEPHLANLTMRLYFQYRAEKKPNDTPNHSITVKPLMERTFNAVCPVNMLLIHALRQGLVEGTSLHNILQRAYEREDKEVIWTRRDLPVLPTRTVAGKFLDLEQAMSTSTALQGMRDFVETAGLATDMNNGTLKNGIEDNIEDNGEVSNENSNDGPDHAAGGVLAQRPGATLDNELRSCARATLNPESDEVQAPRPDRLRAPAGANPPAFPPFQAFAAERIRFASPEIFIALMEKYNIVRSAQFSQVAHGHKDDQEQYAVFGNARDEPQAWVNACETCADQGDTWATLIFFDYVKHCQQEHNIIIQDGVHHCTREGCEQQFANQYLRKIHVDSDHGFRVGRCSVPGCSSTKIYWKPKTLNAHKRAAHGNDNTTKCLVPGRCRAGRDKGFYKNPYRAHLKKCHKLKTPETRAEFWPSHWGAPL